MFIFYFTRDDAWNVSHLTISGIGWNCNTAKTEDSIGFGSFAFKQLQDSFDEDTLRDTLQKVRLQKMLSWSQKGTEI